jgi:thymidylate synthase
MVTTFHAEGADAVWRSAFDTISKGPKEIQPSRAGDTLELLHCVVTIKDPRQRWIACRVPPLNVAFAIAEVVWIMRARRDSAFLAHRSRSFPSFVGQCTDLSGAYGARLRAHFGVDQIGRAADALAASPSSRQVVLQIWDAAVDLPDQDGTPTSSDVPCNLTSLLKVRNGKLEWTQIMRSNDLFRGLPYNVVQFTMLQEVIAGRIGVDVGSYNQWSDSLHLYVADAGVGYDPLIAPCPNLDRLSLESRVSESCFAELERLLEGMMEDDLTPSRLRTLLEAAQLPNAYQNLALVCAAEEARRRRWGDEVIGFTNACTNPSLLQQFTLWKAWLDSRQVELRALRH